MKKTIITVFCLIIFSSTYGCTPSQPSNNSDLAFTPEPTHTPKPIWVVSDATDEMTGETTYFTYSPNFSPSDQMDFPYEDVVARIVVSCSGNSQLTSIRFSTAPNLVDTDIRDGYDSISTRIKWDDSLEKGTFLQTWGGKSLTFFQPRDEEVISYLTTHETMLLELNWYGEGSVIFEFSLNGAEEGIRAINKLCSGG